jgi:hypothetical protein
MLRFGAGEDNVWLCMLLSVGSTLCGATGGGFSVGTNDANPCCWMLGCC